MRRVIVVFVVLAVWVALSLMGVVLGAAVRRVDREIELDARLSDPATARPS